MLKRLYGLGVNHPWLTLVGVALLTAVFALGLSRLQWETDARVYFPKHHPAIEYDEKVDEWFGIKDAIVIAVVNEKDTIFNAETLARIKRITDKIAALPMVESNRPIDVASLSTATYFFGTESEIGSKPLMPEVPTTPEAIEALKKRVYDNADLFVGNLVSEDGTAAMIRAKIKEGIANRYQAYFAIKGIIAAETGEGGGWWPGGQGDWEKWSRKAGAGPEQAASEEPGPAEGAQQWPENMDGAWPEKAGDWPSDSTDGADQPQGGEAWRKWQSAADQASPSDSPSAQSDQADGNGAAQWGRWPAGEDAPAASGAVEDRFYLAGRPVVEVQSGLLALADLNKMVPAVLMAMVLVLALVFRSWRGVLLPLGVMSAAIVWTMGLMGWLGVPMYTISTMLPVILVAVGIADAVHLLSHYGDAVVRDKDRPAREVVAETVSRLGAPLVTTSVTTAIGFAALLLAEMPPFKVFGLFAMVGILFSWLISVTLVPAVLTLLRPQVSGYYEKRRALRVHGVTSGPARHLVALGRWLGEKPALGWGLVGVLLLFSAVGATQLRVDSSWMEDFPKDSEVYRSNAVLNAKFDGTTFLNVVIEGRQAGIFKDPELLQRMEALQASVERLPQVGGSLSLVDYLKNMNKNLHAGDPAYDRLPESRDLVAEYLFLFSVSGRPQLLDEVVDYDYQKGVIRIAVKSDHTQTLKEVLQHVQDFVAEEFGPLAVTVNYAGSANNAIVWAQLLIDSQTTAIVFSKVAILLIALVLFRRLRDGVAVVAPVIAATLVVSGAAGLAGIPLDVSTALAAGIAIGVGVDYAVHFIYRYRQARAQGLDGDAAVADTLSSVGRAITQNALIVAVGFLVLALSQFPPHQKLGYFVAAYMALSCLAALVLLPLVYHQEAKKKA